MYFANNEGLLEFDGHDWQVYQLPNKTILRSILLKDDVIYAGGQNEFGKYVFDSTQRWRFISLMDRIPAQYTPFGDVWNLCHVNDKLLFRSDDRIYIVGKDEAITVIDQVPAFFLGVANSRVFIQHIEGQLYELLEDTLHLIANSAALTGTELRSIIPYGKDYLLATHKKGLFLLTEKGIQRWNEQNHQALGAPFINNIQSGNNGDIIVATAFEGIILLDKNGAFKYQLRDNDGLPNNKVICTFIDRDKNLWLGLDNGISIVNISSPFSRVLPNGYQDGPGYAVKAFKDKIYFGTSSGLFYTDWRAGSHLGSFQKVQNSDGQVWGLDSINGELILSYISGAFLVENDQARQFNDIGSWLFRSYKKNPKLVFAGDYKGISFYDGQTFEEILSVDDLQESSRFLEEDQHGDIWMSHPYLGIYRVVNPGIPGSQQVIHLGKNAGLPSDLHNHVFKIYDQIVVAAEYGVYTFNSEKETFEVHPTLTEYFGRDTKVRRLIEASNGDVWYVTSKEVGVLKIAKKGLKVNNIQQLSFPELNNMMNRGWEKIYPLNEDHVFITTANGFLHYDGTNDNKTEFNVLLKNIHLHKDSVIHIDCNTNLSDVFTFSYHENDLGFELAATEYFLNEDVTFQYFLEGYDTDWPPFTKQRYKEYAGLPFGDYVLHIRAKRQSGACSDEKTLHIRIQTPWYWANPALAMYALLLGLIILGLYRRANSRYEELEQKVGETIEKSKEEIERLETEKIQAELEHKKRELVSSTMHLMKKNDTIIQLANKLSSIKDRAEDDTIKSELGKLVRVLKQEEVKDDSWEQIMYHFNELHKGFFDKLKQQYPTLTPKDLRLSAYMKMNLTSKEIATLMNLSVRGIEASRYRLRKKLDLDSDVNLNEFFMGFE